ncbi:MAG: ribosome small subunit-dependent GTPase A [Desulfobacter sp.]|nr:MAG: ribosome small subunit-dependent GTPase A [Desulfobacter sp.]
MKKKKNQHSSGVAEEKGTIIAHYGIAVGVLFESGQRRKIKVKRRAGHVVGDNVILRGHRLEGLPRKTALSRRDSRGSVRIIGANLDILGIVVSPLPAPTAGFIDQAVICARQAGLTPVLVINKSDLDIADAFVSDITSLYQGILDIFVVSAHAGHGLDRLTAFLGNGHRGFFVGVSGAGKSSLLNTICPELDLRIGDLYDAGKRGCNTTTVSTLHKLPGGGELVDTPGFNEFGLVDVRMEDLADVFPGFESLDPGACRFRNCRHRTEPGCALSEMLEQGTISRERYEAYLAIMDQLEAGDDLFRKRR